MQSLWDVFTSVLSSDRKPLRPGRELYAPMAKLEEWLVQATLSDHADLCPRALKRLEFNNRLRLVASQKDAGTAELQGRILIPARWDTPCGRTSIHRPP